MYQISLVLLLAVSSSIGGPLVKKCPAGDAECAKKSAIAAVPAFAAGVPEFGMKPLDPVTVKRTDASSPNLKLIVTDYTVTGLRNVDVKYVKFDKEQSKIFLKLEASAQLEGHYDMKGQLLVLPLEGNGPLHVTLNKADFDIELDVKEIEKDGVKYWDIKSWRHTFELKGKSKVVFDNLFSGSDVLGKAAKDVIDESGNEIILEVGAPVIFDTLKEVVKSVNRFFHHVPLSELVE